MKEPSLTSISFQTLGCRLNQYETDSLASQFQRGGYRIVPFGEASDIQVVNTCTVTNKADRKSRNQVNKALKIAQEAEAVCRTKPLVVVTGCGTANDNPWQEDDKLLVVDNEHKAGLFHVVDAWVRGESSPLRHGSSGLFDYPGTAPGFHTRGSIKIQDGCDNFCTFCIIPFVRGHAISRPVDQILENCRDLIAQGSKELVLTGVNMARYRQGETDFTTLVRLILDLDLPPGQDFRLRIASLEPDGLGPGFVALFSHPRLCPSLHLCLQSASSRILTAMGRQYSPEDYLSLALALKAQRPDIHLSTDLIAGFPGEDESDHQESLAFVEKLGFGSIHPFTYSRRRGTKADTMDGQIPEQVKNKRHKDLVLAGERLMAAYGASLSGTSARVVIEAVDLLDGRLIGKGRDERGLEVALDLGPGPQDGSNPGERSSRPGPWWNSWVDCTLTWDQGLLGTPQGGKK